MVALTLFFSQIDHDLIGSDINIKSAKKDEQTQQHSNAFSQKDRIISFF